jgi:hypothetical protein
MRDDDFVKDEQSSVVGHRSSDDRRLTTDDLAQEPLDETLMAHARTYHAPGAVPREEMWSAIRDGRDERDGQNGRVLPFRRAVRIALPIAAVLAVGIFVGRMSMGPEVTGHASRVASQEPASSDTQESSPRAQRGDEAPGQVLASSAAPRPQSDTARMARDTRHATAEPPSRRAADSRVPRPESVFAVAAERHFAQAETFLTLFRASVREGKDESLAPATARELLVSNRLLMDSPAADDPNVSRLLDDIELVLAQIAQLPAEGTQADAQIITDGLEAGGVLTRIRTEVTSGPVAALPQGAL